jgi:hypothetical protein
MEEFIETILINNVKTEISIRHYSNGFVRVHTRYPVNGHLYYKDFSQEDMIGNSISVERACVELCKMIIENEDWVYSVEYKQYQFSQNGRVSISDFFGSSFDSTDACCKLVYDSQKDIAMDNISIEQDEKNLDKSIEDFLVTVKKYRRFEEYLKEQEKHD